MRSTPYKSSLSSFHYLPSNRFRSASMTAAAGVWSRSRRAAWRWSRQEAAQGRGVGQRGGSGGDLFEERRRGRAADRLIPEGQGADAVVVGRKFLQADHLAPLQGRLDGRGPAARRDPGQPLVQLGATVVLEQDVGQQGIEERPGTVGESFPIDQAEDVRDLGPGRPGIPGRPHDRHLDRPGQPVVVRARPGRGSASARSSATT